MKTGEGYRPIGPLVMIQETVHGYLLPIFLKIVSL